MHISTGQTHLTVYLGTYTRGASEGIYIYRLDVSSGATHFVGKVVGIENPTYLIADPEGRFLFAANEVEQFQGRSGGSVSAFAIDRRSGMLILLNQKPTHGATPCHLSLDRSGRFLFVANYGGGSISVLPVQSGGWLGDPVDVVQHSGHGPTERQEGPHPHCIVLDDSEARALVADLGLDKVFVYSFDREQGRLDHRPLQSVQTAAGAGPRFLAFHPSGPFVYLANELNSTLGVYSYNAADGSLRELETVSTLPDSFRGRNTASEVRLAPSGRFVYVSNRGHDSIAIFEVNPETGRLTLVGHEPTRSNSPRGFAIDPTGTWLLAANQKSDTVTVFRINQETGELIPTEQIAPVPTPTCVCIAPLPSGAP